MELPRKTCPRCGGKGLIINSDAVRYHAVLTDHKKKAYEFAAFVVQLGGFPRIADASWAETCLVKGEFPCNEQWPKHLKAMKEWWGDDREAANESDS